MNSDNDVQDTGNGHSGRPALLKKENIKLIIKIALVVLIFVVVFYIIYYTVNYSGANFILSNQEIGSAGDKTVKIYKPGEKIYFFISRRGQNLDAGLFIIEIDYFENEAYQRYKQISYELDKNFVKLNASIPTEYFLRQGKYQVKASLDGKIVSTRKIEVIQ